MRRRRLFGPTRRATYRAGAVMGDLDALAHPDKLAKRAANRWIGRNIVRRLWFR